VFGYEALVRSARSELSSPVSRGLPTAPVDTLVFINLHALDLTHESLYTEHAPLSPFAERIVLEVTERSSLQRIEDLRGRIERLRGLGYRIAVDDLGAGYAGVSSFSQLEPEGLGAPLGQGPAPCRRGYPTPAHTCSPP
jgi:EAL domain-containing protein (putative c-di-GMP-specific phosphodiesterase class I)